VRRVGETAAHELFVDRRVAARNESQSNLRLGTVEGFADKIATFLSHGDDAAGFHIVGIQDVAAIYPEMPASNAFGAALPDRDQSTLHQQFPPCTFRTSTTAFHPN